MYCYVNRWLQRSFLHRGMGVDDCGSETNWVGHEYYDCICSMYNLGIIFLPSDTHSFLVCRPLARHVPL